ncbi:MAG: hypothetical protein OIF34_07040, partial [Porticoccaceae bacterium]|nr:hypothetical protein [Porticoccaceae bacterium]
MSNHNTDSCKPLDTAGEQLSAAEYLRQILLAPVGEVAVVTPLSDMPRLSARLQNTVSLKREDRQPVHSYKLRGAYNKLVNLSSEQK